MLFLIGCMVGAIAGVTAICLCIVAGQADRHMHDNDSERNISDN